MTLSVQFSVLRTRELRELLEDEEKMNHTVRCSDKFQELKKATEKMLLSNQKLAKSSLSQRPKFRDAKFLLAVKYKELEKLKNIIQAKQERLAEKNSAHYVQHCLMKKINDAEEECEQIHNPSRVPAVLWPTCCHPLTSPPLIYPPILLPFGAHVGTDHCLQDLSFCLNSVSLHPGLHGQGVKWPVRPVRLQPLKGQHRRHEQGPR
ncbi:vacuolar protein sorting-associated protein 37D-like isoform X3 [Sphaeramia orbicularis]|uniref:vacuolar protein sorting-associated protein 37D-like isoform X3 n=1 Tax=Sphaeramia orbicularis TaxID=375764 RepID=UPI00117DD6BA|nr:vacuolar protein sorting-associated protein 37D-like isoform X3 [Sphaeramia orbicularis]